MEKKQTRKPVKEEIPPEMMEQASGGGGLDYPVQCPRCKDIMMKSQYGAHIMNCKFNGLEWIEE